ncbi:MAG: ATP-dependent DNA ligase, partial [Micrococcales bacterium]
MSLRRTGLGWRSLSRLPAAAAQPQLAVHDVDARLTAIAQLSGPGSVAARREAAEALFGRATAAEQRFVVNLLTGQLRHGALDSAMLDAIAAAFEVPLVEVRRAAMLGGSPAAAAYAAAAGGEAALARIAMRVGTGVRPMLAAS